LWNSKFRAIYNIEPYVVTEFLKRQNEVVKNFMLRDSWYIFHRDDIWICLLCKTSEVIQQPPLSVFAIRLVALRIGGKRLAWCASRENRQVCIAEKILQFLGCDFANILLYESRLIVCLIWKSACRIKINARDNRQPLQHKAMR